MGNGASASSSAKKSASAPLAKPRRTSIFTTSTTHNSINQEALSTEGQRIESALDNESTGSGYNDDEDPELPPPVDGINSAQDLAELLKKFYAAVNPGEKSDEEIMILGERGFDEGHGDLPHLFDLLAEKYGRRPEDFIVEHQQDQQHQSQQENDLSRGRQELDTQLTQDDAPPGISSHSERTQTPQPLQPRDVNDTAFHDSMPGGGNNYDPAPPKDSQSHHSIISTTNSGASDEMPRHSDEHEEKISATLADLAEALHKAHDESDELQEKYERISLEYHQVREQLELAKQEGIEKDSHIQSLKGRILKLEGENTHLAKTQKNIENEHQKALKRLEHSESKSAVIQSKVGPIFNRPPYLSWPLLFLTHKICTVCTFRFLNYQIDILDQEGIHEKMQASLKERDLWRERSDLSDKKLASAFEKIVRLTKVSQATREMTVALAEQLRTAVAEKDELAGRLKAAIQTVEHTEASSLGILDTIKEATTHARTFITEAEIKASTKAAEERLAIRRKQAHIVQEQQQKRAAENDAIHTANLADSLAIMYEAEFAKAAARGDHDYESRVCLASENKAFLHQELQTRFDHRNAIKAFQPGLPA
eukprot:UC4_evm7s866